jgi:hypothetical protein
MMIQVGTKPAAPPPPPASFPPQPEHEPERESPKGIGRLCEGNGEPTLLTLGTSHYASCCPVGPGTTLACTLTEASQHSPYLTSDILFVDLVRGTRWRSLGAIERNLGMSRGAAPVVGFDAVATDDGFELRITEPTECKKHHCNGGVVAHGDTFVGTTDCVPVQKLCAAAGRYRWDGDGFPRRVR